MEMPLISQATAAPTRKWNYGAFFSVVVAVIIAGLTAFDAELAGRWVPVITAIAGGLGFAIPSYLVKNRAVPLN